ncbi:hypothetical protein AB1Y20_000173 [Prymnesium parvum]|uniref:Inosine/uridine-preferring nucleoside hydrolase domain-containing protein n=1 Tax=Prymnesium parvum TaxID=97485 RepID=A0AB34K7Q6_PRYPA
MGFSALPALLQAAALASTPRPIILSTDPGIDDSIAILLALASPELALKAVCIDFGSLANLTQLEHNALAVLALGGGASVPVYRGAAAPLAAPFHDLGGPLFHGKDGVGGVPPPALPSHGVNLTLSGAEAIVEACRTWRPAPVLVSLAPLTNLALALALEPRLPQLCPDVYVMGGTLAAPGNVSPLAEANLANDAEAAQRVFDAGFALRVAGLDVTMATWLDQSYLDSLRSLPNAAGPWVWNMTRFYTRAYRNNGYRGGMPLHDPSALLMLLRPDIYSMKRWTATVDTTPYPSPTRGLVIADRRGGPLSPPSNSSTQFAMDVDVHAVQLFLRERLSRSP